MLPYNELPTVFYEHLEPHGWEHDYVNSCHILTLENAQGMALEVWPLKDEPDVVEIEARTSSTYEKCLFRIEHQQQAQYIVDCLIQYASAVSYHALLTALLQNPGIQVYTLKFYQPNQGDETRSYQRQVMLENLHTLNHPQFEPIFWIDFYLAVKISGVLVIPVEKFPLAYQRLVEIAHFKESHVSEVHSFPEAIAKCYYEAPQLDAHGNIVDLPFGGDIWDFELLNLLKDLFAPGSGIILQDDGNVYWKVAIHPDKIVYYREVLRD